MKISKKIQLPLLGVSIFVLVGYLFIGSEENKNCGEDCSLVESIQSIGTYGTDGPSESEKIVQVVSKEQDTALLNTGQAINQDEKPKIEKESHKRHYDEDWCIAKDELNESDYRFAQTEYNDWLIAIGKARSRSKGGRYFKESAYPNYSLIEPYESLPLEQLEALALQGDKWAMVTFVQQRKASDELKDEVAKKLMVTGASYYALQHFVMNSLLEAQISADKKQGYEVIAGHVTDALAYVYWGIEHYNEGGLTPFMSVAFSERVKSKIPIDSILVNSVNEVNTKISELNNWVVEQRVAQGMDMPVLPKAVPSFFANRLAAKESVFEQEFELLRRLDITNSNRLMSNDCVNTNLSDIREKTP